MYNCLLKCKGKFNQELKHCHVKKCLQNSWFGYLQTQYMKDLSSMGIHLPQLENEENIAVFTFQMVKEVHEKKILKYFQKHYLILGRSN